MTLYYFLQNKKNKWILGTDNEFSAWNTFKDNAQRFNTKEEAEAKLTTLGLAEQAEVTKTAIPAKPTMGKKDSDV